MGKGEIGLGLLPFVLSLNFRIQCHSLLEYTWFCLNNHFHLIFIAYKTQLLLWICLILFDVIFRLFLVCLFRLCHFFLFLLFLFILYLVFHLLFFHGIRFFFTLFLFTISLIYYIFLPNYLILNPLLVYLPR